MRRIIGLLAGVLLGVMGFGSDCPRGNDGEAAKVDDIQGEWRLVSMEHDGNVYAPSPKVRTYQAGKWVAGFPGPAEGTYTTDPGRKPAHLDETTTSRGKRGQLAKYIYRIDGDALQIGTTRDGVVRPKNFEEKGIFVFTLERVKK